MKTYEQLLREYAPELNATHMETLALSIGSTLNGMPNEFFRDIAKLARQYGAEWLAGHHRAMTVEQV